MTIETKDLAGKAFSGAFKLTALKLEKDDAGRLAEREVQSFPVTTVDGKATVSVALAAEFATTPLDVRLQHIKPYAIDRWLATQPKPFSIVEIPVRVQEKRRPAINLVKRVPNVLLNLARLTYAIRVKR